MKHNYKVTGTERKRLVGIVSQTTGAEAQYQFTPTCAYEIGAFTVDREGALIYDDGTDDDMALKVLDAIEEAGFKEQELAADTPAAEEPAMETPAAEISAEGEEPSTEAAADEEVQEEDTFIIKVPKDKVDTGKMANLLGAKGYLIEKALGVDDLPVEIGEDEVSFPWFKGKPDDDTAAAWTNFITALCRMTLEQKRISATEKPAENEKYAFRCFLLRLGFIGSDYKKDRKILLQNLTGSSAFKARKEAGDEISA